MDSFNESVAVYLERFGLFVQASGLANAKKAPMFLSVLSRHAYNLLCNLVSLALPKDKSFGDLTRELNHFEPKKVVIVERFNFYHCEQQSGESIATYV